MADSNVNTLDLTADEILAQIEQEEKLKEMIESSANALKATMEDIDDKFLNIDEEGNEWKTRFETQVEINNRLKWQVDDLKQKIQLKSYGKNTLQNLDEVSSAKLRAMVRKLERDKLIANNQLRNLEWRLDQESKALHKALEIRKKYTTEIAEASYNLNSYQRLQKSDEIKKYQNGQPNKNLHLKKFQTKF